MFNRNSNGDIQRLEERIADLERVVEQHTKMLNAIKDQTIENMDNFPPIFSALGLSMLLLSADKREVLQNAISDIVRETKDRDHAARMKSIYTEQLDLTLTD